MIKSIIDAVMGVIDKIIPDANKKIELKKEISTALIDNEAVWRTEAVKLQTHSSGVKWIDGFKHLIRPLIALCLFAQYTLWKFGLIEVWTKTDTYLLGAVVGFYFISRGIEKSITKVL